MTDASGVEVYLMHQDRLGEPSEVHEFRFSGDEILPMRLESRIGAEKFIPFGTGGQPLGDIYIGADYRVIKPFF